MKELIDQSSKKTTACLTKQLNNVILEVKDVPADEKITQENIHPWIEYYTESFDAVNYVIATGKSQIDYSLSYNGDNI